MARLQLLTDTFATAIGEMIVAADVDGNLRAVDWTDRNGRFESLLNRYYGDDSSHAGWSATPSKNPFGMSAAIAEYLTGNFSALDQLPTASAGTDFQRDVWQALRTIPAGATISYGELARRIGNPAAVRAVGAANGANPISLVVPCHRVVGASGELTGYGGGIERKRWLLAHESRHLPLFAQTPVALQ